MLILTEEEILRAVELEEIVDVIEGSMKLYETGDYDMPTRLHMDYDENTLLLMPCSAEKRVGTKLLTLTPDNEERNLPVIQGCFVLNDAETGEILALIEASSLTALRTGAVGGVSIKHMTPEEVNSVGIIGAGVQGLHQAIYASEIRDIKDIYVFDIDPKQVTDFTDELSKRKPNINIHTAGSNEELLHKSDVIITTTAANKPVLPDHKKAFKGKHVIGIGSYKPDMREFPEAIYDEVDDVFIDTEDAFKETGDLIHPLEQGWINKNQVHTIGKLIDGQLSINKKGTTFFKSVGMALFDLVVANLVYDNAFEKGIGQKLDF